MMQIEHMMHLVKKIPVDSEYSALFHIEHDNCDLDAKNSIRFTKIKNDSQICVDEVNLVKTSACC